MNLVKMDGERLRVNAILNPLGLFFFAVLFLAGCTKSTPNDGGNATPKRFDNLRDMRYCEVFWIGGDPLTHDQKLKLAPGWKYRVKVLDQDLTIRAVDGHARIVQDDLENTYDACFETACTYKP